jgi:hypothetical protein
MRRLMLVSCLLAATGCTENAPAAPSAPLNQELTIARGSTVTISGTSTRLQFVEVTNDSRCPADAICITGGDAIVHVRMLDGISAAPYELHTGDTARAVFTHRQFRVRLIQLAPYPFSSRTIAQDDYRATIAVTTP